LTRWAYAQALCLALATSATAEDAPQAPDGASAWTRPLLLGAHRGGAGVWPENTVEAFVQAAAAYPDILLEGDLQLSRDGAVVLMHDRTVDRTTDGSGAVKDLTLAELKALDGGYRFSRDGGKTFPLRGQGIAIPTLDEILTQLPKNRILFELKDGDGLAEKAAAIIRKHGAEDRIIIASFQPALMAALKRAMPEVATCFDMPGALALLTALRVGDWDSYTPTDQMLSIPSRYVAEFQLTAEEFGRVRAKGVLVQVHTLNDAEEIRHFIEMGVDSILTDYPERLAAHMHKRRGE